MANLLMSLMLILVSSIAIAAPKTQSRSKAKERKEAVNDLRPAPKLSSADNREGKVGYAVAELIGLTLLPVQGIRGGYFIDSNFVGELSYASGGGIAGDVKAAKTLIEAKGKYFFGNSFYVDGGLAHESWDISESVLSAGDAFGSRYSAAITNTGFTFHVGNQWQWPGFTLGCDWVGYFVALSTTSSFDADASADADAMAKEEKQAKTNYGGGSTHVTRFYLGWSF